MEKTNCIEHHPRHIAKFAFIWFIGFREEEEDEEFEDTKGVIRIRISKNRKHNGKM